ncbi:MAG TPA: 50S ribosomal protein L11 methyltransferase [Parvularculaceae bacterium]|nr:50S ribosomal protein L11 methyltransferase [Parvularculaceae bacterium]
MPAFKATWTGTEAALNGAGVLLTDVLFPPADAISLTKDDDTAADERTGWKLEAYFSDRPDEAALSTLLKDAGAGTPEIEELPDIDWVAHALEGLGVVDAGRFVLHGSHDADKIPEEGDRIAIRIDANQAFGTGHHPTTAGCLELLSRFAGAPPETVLDLGCGSAVLAIAAAKLWDVEVLASDIDEKSVEIANENIALNGVEDLANAIAADGFSDPRIKVRAPYDFIFANILAGPLVDFAPAMANHLRPAGRVMLAGLMADQEAGVKDAYERAGFKLINRLDHKIWPVLLFVKL